jgi:DNA polymerase-1
MQVLFLDAYNLIYRARYGFMKGENATIFGFFRSLRPLIEKFNPDKAYFVLEGYPKHRYELAPDYKGTRTRDNDESFHRQKDMIISLMKEYFPIISIRHSEYECDDVLGNLVRYTHADDLCTVISSDTDFLQLYNTHKNVKIYNPVRKKVLDKPGYDYVAWKSLRGDGADNIKGIKGIGDKRAQNLMEDPKKLQELLGKDENQQIFERNQQLISFADLRNSFSEFEVSSPSVNWTSLKNIFQELEFDSITNEKSWIKFQQTFLRLEHGFGV